MVKFINGWEAPTKQWDKVDITLRISLLTIFSLKLDKSDKKWEVRLFNIGFSNK